MAYYIGQFFGIMAALSSIIYPFFKHKWQMLIVSNISNIFMVLNLILLGETSSAMFINFVAIVQTFLTLWRVVKDKPTPKHDKVIFTILYFACGILGFKSLIDVLPIIGVVFYMLATFQRDEQKTRYLSILNAGTYFFYFLYIGSTTIFMEVVIIITCCTAIYKYRKKE